MSEEEEFPTWRTNPLIHETPANELRATLKALCGTDPDLRARIGRLKLQEDKLPRARRRRRSTANVKILIEQKKWRREFFVVPCIKCGKGLSVKVKDVGKDVDGPCYLHEKPVTMKHGHRV